MRTIFYICLCFLPLFLSCEMKKDLFGSGKEPDAKPSYENLGLLDLELDAKREPAAPDTKGDSNDDEALNPDDFSITVLDSIGQVVKRFDSYTDMRNAGDLLLPVGTYTVRAESGNNPNAGFNSPFYAGDTICVISAKEVAKVITSCYLQNKKVQFACSGDFLKKFNDDYSIVIDNGLGVIATSRQEGRVAYLKDTGTLRFTIYASTLANKACTYSYDLSKESQLQGHNNIYISLDALEEKPDSPDEPGGNEPDVPGDPGDPDSPENPEDPDKPTDPEVPEHPTKLPVIKVDISLIEKDYVIEIPSDFVESGKPGIPGGGDEDKPENPGGDGDKPGEGEDPSKEEPTITGTIDGKSFDVNTTQTITSSTKSVVINMHLPTGLEELTAKVKIGSDNLSLDLLNYKGHELESVLASMDLPLKGDKGDLEFDITPFLSMLETNNSFEVTVKDKNGESITKTIKLSKGK